MRRQCSSCVIPGHGDKTDECGGLEAVCGRARMKVFLGFYDILEASRPLETLMRKTPLADQMKLFDDFVKPKTKFKKSDSQKTLPNNRFSERGRVPNIKTTTATTTSNNLKRCRASSTGPRNCIHTHHPIYRRNVSSQTHQVRVKSCMLVWGEDLYLKRIFPPSY